MSRRELVKEQDAKKFLKALERIRHYRKQRDELFQELACTQAKLLEAAELLKDCQHALCWPVTERDGVPPHNLVEQIGQFLDTFSPNPWQE